MSNVRKILDTIHLIRAACAGQLGRLLEGQEALEKIREIVPDYSLERFHRKTMWTSEPDIKRLAAGLKAAGIS